MENPVVHFSTVFMAFFAIMNPIANAPLFLGLTDGLDRDEKRRVAFWAVVCAFVIVATFSIVGREIFHVFGITLPAFKITGGVLIALVGYHMLQGEQSSVHAPDSSDHEDSRDATLGIAITPLALPMLAGPGTIATAMNFAANSTLPEIGRVLAAFAAMCLITWVSFLGAQSMTRFLGRYGIRAITRLMGLLLAVIGVQMLIAGIEGAVSLARAG